MIISLLTFLQRAEVTVSSVCQSANHSVYKPQNFAEDMMIARVVVIRGSWDAW